MNYAPFARIALRYGAACLFGMAQAEALAADPDIVMAIALAIGAAVEASYLWAKRKGWAT